MSENVFVNKTRIIAKNIQRRPVIFLNPLMGQFHKSRLGFNVITSGNLV